jgi:uracil-DNA glycosylase family 4
MNEILSEFKNLRQIDQKLFEEIQGCNKCPISTLSVNKLNPPNGKVELTGTFYRDSRTRLLFIGIAPSYRRFDRDMRAMFPEDLHENSSGAMFLRALVDAGYIKTYDIYLTNLIRCSTETNSFPVSTEIDNCGEFLEKEIKLIKPTHLIPMGWSVYNYVNDVLLGRLAFYKYRSLTLHIKHPAYYFRNKNYDEMVSELVKLKGHII